MPVFHGVAATSGKIELRRIVALLFMCLLPLQTLASLAMPIQGGQRGAAAHHAMEGGHCDHGGQPADDRNAPPGNACEQCGICHLACAGMMPSAEALTPDVPSGNAYAAETVLPLVSHTPEEPNPPPVAARS